MAAEAPTFSIEIAHRTTELLPNTVYTFNPDGSAYVNQKRHMYFSRTPSRGRDIGYMPLSGRELVDYQTANVASRAGLLQEGVIKIGKAA